MARQAVRPVNFGVLLDARVQERWVLESLQQVLTVPGTQLVVIAVAGGLSRGSFAAHLHRLLDRLDMQLRCRNERLFVPVDIAAELKAPLLDIGVVRDGEGWRPDEAGLGALRRCNVDVWLCFTAVPPRRPLCPVSGLGVWGIEIGQDVSAASAWAGAMEVGAGSPVTMVSIVDYAESRNGLLYRTFGATLKNSIRRNRLSCLRKAMSLFRRLLERLTRDGENWRSAQPATLTVPANYPALREPTVSALTRLSSRLVSHVAANQLRPLRWLDQWQIAYHFADEDEAGLPFEQWRHLVPSKNHFWADPFAVEHHGRYFIFFEELNRTIELYRCEAFPHDWRLHRVLLENVSAYDATLWREGDRWWMFVNIAEPEADSCDELHLYWSTTPLGPWTVHRGNPVVSDARCARPAGPLFSRNGELYRPSQDCSLAYGHSVLINRVDILREDDYRETTVHRITPGWKECILRVHTLGRSKRLRVIDCMVSRRQR